jgi:hypothetical protein
MTIETVPLRDEWEQVDEKHETKLGGYAKALRFDEIIKPYSCVAIWTG